jgi:outer membrane receptor protein involved in Fe transport
MVLIGANCARAADDAQPAGAVSATDVAPPSDAIAEITVTAQRRNESLQNVPITVQAITGDQLKQLDLVSFNDLIKYTPNVTFSGNGPGTGNIYVRGLGGVNNGNQSQSVTAPFPSVALYLDDQSMQFPSRNNDVYLVDMERVEVLEGPQGTLFGGGAEAGAIRYITNKPKLGMTEGSANGSYGITAGGDPNSSGNLTLNLPLGDHVALRGVVFSERQGGYISNVLDTISIPPVTTASDGGPPVRPGSPTASNASVAGSNLNTLEWQGARLSALAEFNDDWHLLLQQNYQRFEADGYQFEYPRDSNGNPLGPDQVDAFTPAYNKDQYESTAWTLDGRFAGLKAVYTGSYLTRNVDAQQDYSNYLRSVHGAYYACTGMGAGYSYFRSAKPTTCYAPVASWHDEVHNTHQSHELRISTDDQDLRVRGLAGAYWESFDIYDQQNQNYMAIPQCNAQNLAASQAGGPDCVTSVGPVLPGYYAASPGYRTDSDTAFGFDAARGYRQTAFFGSVDIDILPKTLTLTAGTRHYDYSEYEKGQEFYSGTSSVLNVPNGTCTHCGFGFNLRKSESGFRSRANLTWHVTPDVLAYYTWSQGFRPGSFNREPTLPDGSGIVLRSTAPYTAGGQNYQYNKPYGYDSDTLVNNEIGLKTEFLDHRLQLNASIYRMDWDNVQLQLYDPANLGGASFIVNGASYVIRGAELQLVARVTQGLTIQGSSSWNSSEQTTAPCLASNVNSPGNPTPVGTCITQIKGQPYTNPYGALGSRLPYSPPVQFNLRGRYDLALASYNTFASFGATHVASMSNEPSTFPSGTSASEAIPTTTLLRYQIPGYTTYDAALGVARDTWSVQFNINNVFNSAAVTNITSGGFIEAEVPVRPRVMTLSVGYKF